MDKIVLHLCSNIQRETENVVSSLKKINLELKIFPSFCGRPKLEEHELKLTGKDDNNVRHLVLGSSCLQNLKNLDRQNLNFVIVDNCFQLFLNKDLIDHYILDGAYLISPNWLKNWKKNLELWKFDQITAKDFFSESCKYLLLLDTGVIPDIDFYLKEFSLYVNRESRSLPVGLDYFKLTLSNLLLEHNLSSIHPLMQSFSYSQ